MTHQNKDVCLNAFVPCDTMWRSKKHVCVCMLNVYKRDLYIQRLFVCYWLYPWHAVWGIHQRNERLSSDSSMSMYLYTEDTWCEEIKERCECIQNDAFNVCTLQVSVSMTWCVEMKVWANLHVHVHVVYTEGTWCEEIKERCECIQCVQNDVCTFLHDMMCGEIKCVLTCFANM